MKKYLIFALLMMVCTMSVLAAPQMTEPVVESNETAVNEAKEDNESAELMGQYGDLFYDIETNYEDNEYYIEITGCSESATSITIPSYIAGYSVTSIGDRAFSGCTGLTSVTIPDSVTSIGRWAFDGCTGLTSVTIGNGVTSIGYFAFADCTKLQEVHITDIGAWCKIVHESGGDHELLDNASLYLNGELASEIVVPEGIKTINERAFKNCKSIKSITLPNSVTSIGDDAFYGCTGLVSVTIPDSVTSIGSFAFYGCTKLQEVHITDIGAWCKIVHDEEYGSGILDNASLYLNGELVSEVIVPEGIKTINNFAFKNCKSLESITLPESVTSIGENAFYGCSFLKNVSIADGVTSIGTNAFYNCSYLKKMEIPKSVTQIGDNAFFGCKRLEAFTVDQDNTVFSNDEYGVLLDKSKKSLLNYPAGRLADTYTLPASVENISENAFRYSFNLKDIYVDEESAHFSNDENGILYNKNKTALVQFPLGKTSKRIVLPDGIVTIEKNAFRESKTIQRLVVPDSVKSVKSNAFRDCPNLIICCNKDSYIEAYAIENNIKYTNDIGVIGDVNNSGTIDIRDVVLLAQYCAEWPGALDTVNPDAADTNGDGSVDTRDVILLAQYCAGWDVTLG